MAQTQFFGSRSDWSQLVSFLIAEYSAVFVPERSYERPHFPRYSALAEVQAHADNTVHGRRFAVLSPTWEKFPLVYHETHANDGQHFFSVKHRTGGPAFDLLLPGLFTDEGGRSICVGMVR